MHELNEKPIDPRLVQNDMRLMGQPWLCIPRATRPFDRAIAIVRPEIDLDDMIGFSKQLFSNPEAFEDLDSATLDTICLAHLHRSVTALKDLASHTIPGEPGRSAKTS